jgi:hypothetical protein
LAFHTFGEKVATRANVVEALAIPNGDDARELRRIAILASLDM